MQIRRSKYFRRLVGWFVGTLVGWFVRILVGRSVAGRSVCPSVDNVMSTFLHRLRSHFALEEMGVI